MKMRIGSMLILAILIVFIGMTSISPAQAHKKNSLTAYMVDGNRHDAMLVYDGDYLLPAAWRVYPLTLSLTKAFYAAPVEGGYLVFKVALYGTWHLTTCDTGVWRYPCPANATAYDVRGRIYFSKTFPAYAALINYDQVNLKVATFPDQGPANIVCDAPLENTIRECLRVAR